MKAYQVLNAQGKQVWETNNLLAAHNRADRIGGTVAFNYDYNNGTEAARLQAAAKNILAVAAANQWVIS